MNMKEIMDGPAFLDIYSIEVQCSNCGYEGTTQVKKGTELTRAECPRCGCYTLDRSIRPSLGQGIDILAKTIKENSMLPCDEFANVSHLNKKGK